MCAYKWDNSNKQWQITVPCVLPSGDDRYGDRYGDRDRGYGDRSRGYGDRDRGYGDRSDSHESAWKLCGISSGRRDRATERTQSLILNGLNFCLERWIYICEVDYFSTLRWCRLLKSFLMEYKTCIVNTIATDILATQRTRASVDMVPILVLPEYPSFRRVNSLRPRQNGRHFADNIFKCIFLNENIWILIKISLKFVPKGPINNIAALVQIMAWRRPGGKPLSGPMMVSLLTHICVARPQWVNPSCGKLFFYELEENSPTLRDEIANTLQMPFQARPISWSLSWLGYMVSIGSTMQIQIIRYELCLRANKACLS